jgi:KilA-N domain
MLQKSAAMRANQKPEPIMNASGLVVRTWNDAPISRRDGDGYADATAMCQANGKRWNHYQENDRTTAYIQALAASLNLPADQLVLTTTTGPNHLRGTWIHPRLAVDLARWLSPEFAVWMDGWFLEQLGQAQPAPALQGDAWRTMDKDEWLAQPVTIRAAQYLLHDAETGGSRAVELIHSRARQRAEETRLLPSPRRIGQLHDLPPSGVAVILVIHELRNSGRPVRTKDIWPQLNDRWSPQTIANRLRFLRLERFILKRGTGWHLSDSGQALVDQASADASDLAA